MSRTLAPFLCLALLAIACNFGDDGAPSRNGSGAGAGVSADAGTSRQTASGLVEGKDYVVFERVRILDEQGFDRPVEAMSLLMPRGWRTEGGVRWKSVNECRGEMITWQFSADSPDGQIQYRVLPARSFGYQEDPMLRQAAIAAARQGGCGVSQPFDAEQYIEQWARTELGGATVSDIHTPEGMQAGIDQLDAQANATSRQYGTNVNQTSTAVFGTLTWPDGDKGMAQVLVQNAVNRGVGMFDGQPNGWSTTNIPLRAYIRYPPEREDEGIKLFQTFGATHRVNPVWQQAHQQFMTRLGNMEHAGRMERLRLQGEQSAAYARAQSEASDARMRDWERKQISSDASHDRFIQTVREVETWKDPNVGAVELSAGYQHGWSRPDGSVILTNNSLFDPAVELQQNWSRMQKVQR
ncbi:MAG TPA: hypothetical protein VIP46_15995 [Pyrinomonadaceae bacterium]